MITSKTQQKSPVALLLKGEIIQKLKVSKAKMNVYLEDGMPHYMIGNEYRFLESEILKWLESYQPSQERLESDFVDQKGRTLEEYVTEDIVLATLRITKEKLVGLCKNRMPFERVGEKDFFHIQDILDHYRKGPVVILKGTSSARSSKKKYLMPLCLNIPKEVPFIIVDGSYNFNNHNAGTGLVLIENRDTATGISNVRNIKTAKSIVCEFLALLDALRLIKNQKIYKAIIVTDQEAWSKGIAIDVNAYEGSVKPYIKEFNQLWNELQGKTVVKFVGELSNGKKNVLYKKAHTLSRAYKKAAIDHLDL
ncbi:reverse transcriptase-like protein [Bacillus sp. ISL-77]|uniref:reverse transcriptase-like protein n=1 Tax=Bacillus sp. ISL-77 TaxID=2819138 RepID=UPI001BE86AAE|nr:reverse transcriptase-like protein [Bacillus sp. ISL-77]MBT2743897.1 reverse transcriptase-like protein [Bacillus sp. ISL-77]